MSKEKKELVEKGKMGQDVMDTIMQNISTTTDYATFSDADLVIEAAVEDTDLPIVVHLDHGADFDICKKCTYRNRF